MANDDDVRAAALSMPDAHESSHVDVIDFRVRNKIFASLPRPGTMGLRLPPEEQQALLAEDPGSFTPAPGAWGRQGWTRLSLAALDAQRVQELVTEAWRYRAPVRLVAQYDKAASED